MDNFDFLLVRVILPIGSIGFLIVVAILYYKNELRKGQNQHVERMKVLELGLPLPDVELARCKAESNRTGAAGAIGILVPLLLAGSAVGATALIILLTRDLVLQIALLCTIWGVGGLVSLIAVIFSLIVLAEARPSKKITSTEAETPLDSLSPREPIIEKSSKV